MPDESGKRKSQPMNLEEQQSFKLLAEALMILTGSGGVRVISGGEARAILARYGYIEPDTEQRIDGDTDGRGLKP